MILSQMAPAGNRGQPVGIPEFSPTHTVSAPQVFALHPLYLSLDALSASMPAAIQAQIDSVRKELNQSAVDYDATMAAKKQIARAVFDLQGESTLQVGVVTRAGVWV